MMKTEGGGYRAQNGEEFHILGSDAEPLDVHRNIVDDNDAPPVNDELTLFEYLTNLYVWLYRFMD